jgi:hypothetical protein
MTVMNNELVLLGENIRTARQPANPCVTFALVAVGTFMTMLDASIVNISLPSVARTFLIRPLAGLSNGSSSRTL